MTGAARQILEQTDRGGVRIVYGVATGDNTVAVAGAATAVTLPALAPVRSGDYCAILETADGDRLILGVVDDGATEFTPAWSNLSVGNGTESAYYAYSPGRLLVVGYVTFGSTTSISGSVSQTVPNGQTMSSNGSTGFSPLGEFNARDASAPATYPGRVYRSTSTTVSFLIQNAAGTYLALNSLSSSVPMTWTTADVLAYRYDVPV